MMIIKKGMVKVSSTYDRSLHWFLALTCLLLVFTGLGFMFQSFNCIADIFGGLKNLRTVHYFLGLVFIPALFLTAASKWKEAGTFDLPDDIEWLQKAGGYLWKVESLPETGKYNPGQKIFFLCVILVGILMIVSGLLIASPEGQGRELINWMHTLHALGLVLLLPFIVVHVYLGTIGVPGSAALVYTGYTTRAWCLSQCPKWLREKEKDGSLEVFEGN